MNTLLILILAILYGTTMKIADLLDEHGLKWFKGDALLFGVLWGIFGLLFGLTNPIIGQFTLAMIVACIVRGRLDYLNHQIAFLIIIIGLVLSIKFTPILFLTFYFIFVIFGSLRDQLDDRFKKKGIIFLFFESMPYYPIPIFVYCYLYGDWTIFYAFTLFILSYNSIKLVFYKKGYK